jgi:hypothetical protein
MRAMTNAAGDAIETKTSTKSGPRWRRFTCGVLVVLVCILAPVSLLAVWTHNTLLETDQYVDTVGPLAGEPAIQNAVSNRVVQALETNVDLEGEIKAALPEKAAFVAPFVAKGIENFARDATLRFAESDRFQNLWDEANRRAHKQVVAVLTGEGSDRVTTKNGEVAVQLGPIVERVREQLSKLGIDVFSDSGGERASRQLVLFQSEDLTKIQGAVEVFDKVAIWLPILLIVMLALALAISLNRRRTLFRTAIWIAVGMALVLILLSVGRGFYLDAVTSAGANRDAAEAAYNQILDFLRLSASTALVLAVIVAIGAWLAGPGRTATRVRGAFTGLSEGRAGTEPSAVGRFVARYRTPLWVVIIGLALLVLALMNRVTPLTVIVTAVIVALLLILVEFLSRGAPKDDGGGSSSAPARQAPMKASTAKKSS